MRTHTPHPPPPTVHLSQVPCASEGTFLVSNSCPKCNQDVTRALCNIKLGFVSFSMRSHKSCHFLQCWKRSFFTTASGPTTCWGCFGFFSSRNKNMRKHISPLMLKEIPGGLGLPGASQSTWTKGDHCGAASHGGLLGRLCSGAGRSPTFSSPLKVTLGSRTGSTLSTAETVG